MPKVYPRSCIICRHDETNPSSERGHDIDERDYCKVCRTEMAVFRTKVSNRLKGMGILKEPHHRMMNMPSEPPRMRFYRADVSPSELLNRLFPKPEGGCRMCGVAVDPEKDFCDGLSKIEYGISGRCQSCQDDTFRPLEDE